MKVEPRASLRVMFITLDGCKRLMAERILFIATVHILTYSAYIEDKIGKRLEDKVFKPLARFTKKIPIREHFYIIFFII
jgi:hypothetical protein